MEAEFVKKLDHDKLLFMKPGLWLTVSHDLILLPTSFCSCLLYKLLPPGVLSLDQVQFVFDESLSTMLADKVFLPLRDPLVPIHTFILLYALFTGQEVVRKRSRHRTL